MLPSPWIVLLQFVALICFKEVIAPINKCEDSNCINGQCQGGNCVCSVCYAGETCELMDNVSPVFEKSSYEFTILKRPSIGEILGKVSAVDKDADKCSIGSCLCSKMIYSINDKNGGIFTADPLSGEIMLTNGQLNLDKEYTIDVKVTNESPFDNVYDTTTVYVTFGKIKIDINEHLERFKRSVAAPSTLTFTLVQVYPVSTLNVTQVGQKLTFQLTIAFPFGLNTLTVELFAPTATNPIMMLCNPSVLSVGSQVSTPAIPAPTPQGLIGGPTWPYVMYTYTFVNQNNINANPNTLADVSVVISFDAYMLFYPTTPASTLYYVSAGSEYLNSTQIWVGQSGYYSSVDVPAPKPNLTIEGDPAIYPGSTAAFDVILVAPDHYFQLNMEFYTPFNASGLLSFCIASRFYVGASFSCIPPTHNQPSLTSKTLNMITYYTTAAMKLGYITNQLKHDASATGTDKDTIKIKMIMRTNPLAWPGGNTYVGTSLSVTDSNIMSVVHPLKIQIKPPKTNYTGSIPVVLDYLAAQTTVGIGSVQKLVVQITVPPNSELDYTIIASFQSLNTEICGFTFLSAGANVPCLNQVVLSPMFTLSTDNYQVTGNVTIPNIRSVPLTNIATDNVLQYTISFRPINDARNAQGNVITSNVIVLWNGGQSSVLSKTFTLQAPDAASNISNTNMPTFQLYILGNNGNVSISESRTLAFSMTLVPGIVYSPATLEFYLPFNGTAQMKICQASITFIGSNIQCMSKTHLTSKFVFSSRINDTTTYDKLSIPIGALCSDGPIGRTATTNDNVNIQLDFMVLNHPTSTIGAKTTINAGMLLTSNQIWVGNQNIQFVAASALPALVAPNIPALHGSRVDSVTNVVWNNDMAIIQYIIQVAGSTMASLTFSVTSDITAIDNFGVCGMYILQKGNSIPCFVTTNVTTKWAPYSKFNKVYTMTFSPIINSGTTPLSGPSFDENSILLEVPVKFGGTLPATFNVIATLTYNTGTVSLSTPFTLQTTLSRINGTILENEPVFSFNLMSLFNTNIENVSVMGYGEARRGALSVLLKPASIQTLSFSFLSPPGTFNQLDVVSVNILSVGANIPCLVPGMMKFTIKSRTGSLTKDLNTLNLGTVCRREIVPNSVPDNNTLVIEVIFRIWRIPVGNLVSIDFNSLTLVNNDEVFIIKLTINVAPVTSHIVEYNSLNLGVSFTVVSSSTVLSINQNVSLNITVTIPPYTQFSTGAIRIYPIWPVGADSALIVSDNTNFTATFGSNLLFNPLENFRVSSTSSRNTTQLDDISANLGIVQNPGTLYRMGQENYTGTSIADMLTLQFNYRVTDNIVAANGYAFNIIFGAEFGTRRTNQTISVTVSRTNSETITINGTTTLLTNNSVYTQSNELRASVFASLLNGSKLECRNFTIHVASPSIMTLTSVLNVSFTSSGITVQQSSLSLGGYSFNVPTFFLTDQLHLIFGVTLKANTTLSRQRQQSMAVIPIIYACKTLNWPSNPQGNKFINTATDIRFTLQGNPIVIQGCDNDLQVWNSAIIKNCSITAYLSPVSEYGPLMVRSNSGSMWKPHTRGGYYNALRYIDIVFGSLTTVVTVKINSTLANLPLSIAVYGTMDGRAYSYHSTATLTFIGTLATFSLPSPPFNYYGIRISVLKTVKNDAETGLNIDLVGCPTAGVTAPTIEPCPTFLTKPNTAITDFYRRGYLYVAPNLFVCDDVPVRPNYLETYPRCFRTLDSTPTDWQDMGPQVGKVIGYDAALTAVYAIASDLKSYIMSNDNGLTWIGINENGWKITKAIGQLTSAKEIPWTVQTGFDPNSNGTSCNVFIAGAWHFCYDGVYNGGVNRLSWNTCCSP